MISFLLARSLLMFFLELRILILSELVVNWDSKIRPCWGGKGATQAATAPDSTDRTVLFNHLLASPPNHTGCVWLGFQRRVGRWVWAQEKCPPGSLSESMVVFVVKMDVYVDNWWRFTQPLCSRPGGDIEVTEYYQKHQLQVSLWTIQKKAEKREGGMYTSLPRNWFFSFFFLYLFAWPTPFYPLRSHLFDICVYMHIYTQNCTYIVNCGCYSCLMNVFNIRACVSVYQRPMEKHRQRIILRCELCRLSLCFTLGISIHLFKQGRWKVYLFLFCFVLFSGTLNNDDLQGGRRLGTKIDVWLILHRPLQLILIEGCIIQADMKPTP